MPQGRSAYPSHRTFAGESRVLRAMIATVTVLVSSWSPAAAQTLDTKLWEPNARPNAIAVADDIVYIAGGFTYVGPGTGGGAALSAESGAVLPRFPKIDGTVIAVAPDGEGGWFIGGDFKTVGRIPRNRLAH